MTPLPPKKRSRGAEGAPAAAAQPVATQGILTAPPAAVQDDLIAQPSALQEDFIAL